MSHDSRLRTLVSPGLNSPGLGEADVAFRETEDLSSTIEVSAETTHAGVSSAAFDALQVGELVAGRFQVRHLAQVGGMSSIYYAEDLVTGKPVALKTLRRETASLERFEREALRLSSLQHPGIPAYVASGFTGTGQAYLAMEWLEGIDLATYLRQRRLGVQSAVALIQRASEAVAVAHAAGIVHRDLNPNNLFLVGSSPDNVRVLDFGVARLSSEVRPVTEEGARVGTPGYMAPEQVEGKEITPETDVFILGCVLYELLTGQRAFSAPTVSETLALILKDDPAPPSEYNGVIPPELDEVVLACLDKNPRRRPEDAAELVSLLSSLQGLVDTPLSGAPQPSSRATHEQHISSVIVLRDEPAGTFERASQAAAPHGIRVQKSQEGTITLVATGQGTAMDHATRAARCALSIQKSTRTPRISLSTGLTIVEGSTPSGRAFDTALVSLLIHQEEPNSSASRGSTIWLDENTASLLDSRFDVRRVERGYILTGIRETYEPSRTVLGRKTRCVGRKRELSMLDATLHECIEEGMASAVLVTGPPGIGKSRLAYELARKARRMLEPVEIFRGGADSMSAGSPFSLLIQAIHRACNIRNNEPEPSRRKKLLERLERVIAREELGRVSEFLGELIGIRVSEQESPELIAAQRDAILRGDQILRAFEDWLRAECSRQPVLLILDDFHWGDLPTVKFVDSVLRNLSELPFMVMALARPEVHDFFPRLWAQRGVTELRLSGLSRRAATEMIHEVLGNTVAPHVIERVLLRAQGNPYWIEELLRAEDAGQGEDVPDRILLLAQSRIEQLNADARKFLRAGSVFGRKFWMDGARSLLERETLGRSLTVVIRELIESEFLIEREFQTSPGDREFEFANGLLRDAAYSLLPEEEREFAHAQAAEWLEMRGDGEPLPIALHYTLSGESDRARPHYLKAAELALTGNDLERALSCVEEGLSAGATGRDAVALWLVRAEASRWRGDNQSAFRSARMALDASEESQSFHRAAAEAAVAAGKIGDLAACETIAQRLLGRAPSSSADLERAIALSRVATQLVLSGRVELGAELIEASGQVTDRLHPDPNMLGFFYEAKAVHAGATNDPVGRIEFADRAAEYFDDAGDFRNACLQRMSLGFAQVEFGENTEAIRSLREALAVAIRLDLSNSIPIAQAQIGRALTRTGQGEEALHVLEEAAQLFDRHKNLRLAGMSRTYLAETYFTLGQVDLAVDMAERALALLDSFPPLRRIARAELAFAELARGNPETALEHTEQAIAGLDGTTRLPVGETIVRLAAAESWLASGQEEKGRAELERETERLEEIASAMSETKRRSYLEGAPERRRLIALARAEGPWAELKSYLDALQTMNPESLALVPTSSLTETLREIERIQEETNPVLRNLWITQTYHDLSQALASVIDRNNVNWSTFACWASKTAGLSIRNEEIPRLIRKELGWTTDNLEQLKGWAGKLLEKLGLGSKVRSAVSDALREVSQEVAIGNRKVFAELAPLFARFVVLLQQEPTDESVQQFQAGLIPGPVEDGGQELLQRAFGAWHTASGTADDSTRAQLILYGNCLIGFHEQTRLQPHIQGALDAPISTVFQKHLARQFPSWFGRPLAFLVKLFSSSILKEVQQHWQRIATRYAMNLSLPNGQEIPLGQELPSYPDSFPSDLRELSVSDAQVLFERFSPLGEPLPAPGTTNWADLKDRMRFIVKLFRARQQERDLFGPPFSAEQEKLLEQGRVPAGEL